MKVSMNQYSGDTSSQPLASSTRVPAPHTCCTWPDTISIFKPVLRAGYHFIHNASFMLYVWGMESTKHKVLTYLNIFGPGIKRVLYELLDSTPDAGDHLGALQEADGVLGQAHQLRHGASETWTTVKFGTSTGICIECNARMGHGDMIHDSDTGQLLLGHEGVCDALHAVHGADEGDGRAAAHHQAQGAGVLTSHFHNRYGNDRLTIFWCNFKTKSRGVGC